MNQLKENKTIIERAINHIVGQFISGLDFVHYPECGADIKLFETKIIDYINENYQPKTTSTDMEELKKKWLEVRKRNSGLSDEGFEVHEKRKALEVFDFFAPHLSNKSELKKEAVKDVLWRFAEHWNSVHSEVQITTYEVEQFLVLLGYLSSNEKEESGGK